MAISISASYLFRSLGQVLGVALTGALQQAVLSHSLSIRLPPSTPSSVRPQFPPSFSRNDQLTPAPLSLPQTVRDIIRSPSLTIPHLSPLIRTQAILSYLESVDAVFLFSVVMGLGMVGCAMGMRAYAMAGR